LLLTHKEIGTVSEVFRMSHRAKSENLMRRFAGSAAIGHVRYATCGTDDASYAQPFERAHIQKSKWFSFAFNGQLANYQQLRDELLAENENHLARETDTEIILHEISRVLSQKKDADFSDIMQHLGSRFDGAYSLAMLTAKGDMLVARDPLGIKPMCYAFDGAVFAAASENVALLNLGFEPEQIRDLEPGHMATIVDGRFEVRPYASSTQRAHCFFEWVYFANVASSLDQRSVYVTRTHLGQELAQAERANPMFDWTDGQTIVVPVPDTSKAAADAMAYSLGIPSVEGLIRNRYSGRTFIENTPEQRMQRAKAKYTPLREVMAGKRVILVEDSIVRSTTMKVLLSRIYDRGGAREVHVRVACPPIIAPCFYGIDMPTVSELFAPRYLNEQREPDDQVHAMMAANLGCDSLRYLPRAAIARALELPGTSLCQACISGSYPTEAGQRLYQLVLGGAYSAAGRPLET
jgi:amidophosphoribosyltransferase